MTSNWDYGLYTQISLQQLELDEICCAKFHTYTKYIITCVLLLGLRGVSGMDLLVDGEVYVGGNMWFHYLWPCWEGQKHWSNLREHRREHRSYNGCSWDLYVLLDVANVLIVSSQLNSMTFGFVLKIGCW